MTNFYQNWMSQPDSLHQVNQLLVEILKESGHKLGITMLVVMVMAQVIYLGAIHVSGAKDDKWYIKWCNTAMQCSFFSLTETM